MPLAPPKPYYKTPDTRLYLGDCIRLMSNGLPLPSVDLIFADPPFNIGRQYGEYKDNLSDRDYLRWTESWLVSCKYLLKETGSIFVASNLKYQASIRCLMDDVGFLWRDTIAWHYTFGPHQKGKLTPSWVAIHYATKSSTFTWNAPRVPSARQTKYKDSRANPNGRIPDNTWILNPRETDSCFLPSHNAMLESRVCGTFQERTEHPCQMPLAVLERIILMASNEGDVVFDPFLGSGTTAEAALKHKRRAWGCELNEDYLRDIVVPRLAPYIPTPLARETRK